VLVDDVLCAAEVSRGPATPAVLVLVTSLDPEMVYACAQAGAVGCITTQASPGKVIESIRAVYLGEVLFPPRILLDLVAGSKRSAPPAIRRTATLAPREIEVLQTIVHYISASRSAAHLSISINTLRTHLKNALTKLEAESTLEAILIALKEGRIELPP
jgi:DNA-binding NarL/FixJ family response regulator